MSVFTNLLLLTTCLPLMINGAPNKKSDEGNVRSRDFLRPRQNGPAIPNLDSHTGSAAFPSGLPPLSNGFATGIRPLIVPSGTANTGASSGNGGYQPFPTEGAPYQNYTSANGQPASYPFVAAPTSQPAAALSIESAANQIGQSALANQCPSPETVTLPPQTVTLPAQTVTVTAAPQMVTITPQIQTQTVTVTVTITAGPSPACPSNAGSPQAPPVAAPSNLPPLGGLNASAAASVPPIPALPSNGGLGGQGTGNLSLGNQLPAQTGGQASGLLPAMPSGQASGPGTNAVAPYPTNIAAPSVAPSAGPSAGASVAPPAAPSAAPALPSIAALPSGSATPSIPSAPTNVPANSGPSPSNAGQESVPGAAPSAPPNGQAPAQASSPPGPAPSGNAPIPVPSGNALGQPSGAAPVLPPSAPYQNATGPFNGTAPRGSGSSGTMPRVGPTASGFRGPIGGPTAPIRPPLPSGNSIQFPQFQANETKGALPSGLAGPTVQIILPPAIYGTPTPLPSASTSQKAIGPNSPFHGTPAGPTPRPIPPVNESDVQGPELSSFSTAASCSPNNTMAQNITANYDNLKPSSPNAPLLYLGLNYTSFTLSESKPNHLMTEPAATPKAITVAAPFLSFGLNSISVSCGDNPPPGNCSVHIAALGAPSTDTDSAARTGMLRTVLLEENAAQKVWFDETWISLSQVNFAAEIGGQEMAVGVDELCYEIVSAC